MTFRLGRLLLALALVGALATAFAGTALAQTAAMATLMPTTAASRVSGAATLTAQGGQTMVTVRITGGTPNSTHPNHIHSGSCANIGGIVHELNILSTDAQGNATATTLVNAALPSLTGGNFSVQAHAGPGMPTPGVTCGTIVAGAAALPATGSPLGATLPAAAGVGAALAGAAALALRRRAR